MNRYGGGTSPQMELTQLWRMQTGLQPQDLDIATAERSVLRQLAGQVAGIAASDEMARRRELWRRHNQLEQTRPLILCDPENGWNEIITNTQLQCRGALARRWEMELRKENFWGEEMGDDKPVEPYFDVPYTVSPDDWGLATEIHQTDFDGAKNWESAITDYSKDLKRLHAPQFEINWEVTDGSLNLAQELFGDLLQVRRKGTWWWSMGLTVRAMFFRHIDKLYLDMMDSPDELKELISIISNGLMTKLDYLEENGLLTLNNDGTYVGSGGYGFTDELPKRDFKGKVRCKDMWGFCESQETLGISPAMYQEFIFPYEQPLLARFGLNCYGCCEPLELRWPIVKQHANLRRVSCSPWANVEKMAGYLGADYIMSLKLLPTPLSIPTFQPEAARQELRKVFAIARGCRVECLMKDTHTLGHRPENAVEWCRVAKEEARQYE
jgi:hypothetical protein